MMINEYNISVCCCVALMLMLLCGVDTTLFADQVMSRIITPLPHKAEFILAPWNCCFCYHRFPVINPLSVLLSLVPHPWNSTLGTCC